MEEARARTASRSLAERRLAWADVCGKDLWNATNGKWPLLNDTVTLVDLSGNELGVDQLRAVTLEMCILSYAHGFAILSKRLKFTFC